MEFSSRKYSSSLYLVISHSGDAVRSMMNGTHKTINMIIAAKEKRSTDGSNTSDDERNENIVRFCILPIEFTHISTMNEMRRCSSLYR